MAKEERKDLYIFGYGLALIIPLLVLLHSFKGGMGRLSFILVFAVGIVVLLAVLPKIAALKPWKNLWIFVFQAAALDGEILSGARPAALVFLGIAAVMLGITVWDVRRLKVLYETWMRAARFIGLVVSGAILTVVFYLVFAPVGLFLRLARKDMLERRIDPKQESYWHQREYVFNKENYKRQF